MELLRVVGPGPVKTGGGMLTRMINGLDVVEAPKSSVALAVSVRFPGATLVRVMLNGLFVAPPIFIAPEKNSTRTTLPSASVALAVSVIFAGASRALPALRVVRVTVGGLFGTPGSLPRRYSSRLDR